MVQQQHKPALLPASSSSVSSSIVPPLTSATGDDSSSSYLSSSSLGSSASEESNETTFQDEYIAAAADDEVELLDERIDVALQLADALKYLHEQNVIHRDLKPDNIGFDARSGTLKVFDFDIARRVPTTEARNQNEDDDALYHMTHTVGSPRYMSPECAKSEPYNLKADVYSYGLLFHQILTLEKPYDDISDDDHNVLVFSEGIRPHVCDLGLPKVVEEMLTNSFSPRIQDRPTMHLICDTLLEERSNIVRIGTTTNSSSSLTAAATSYVTSCTFESFSDHNPAIKKKMKMMRANKMNKNNNWNITPFKSGKNNSNMSSGNNKVRFSPFRRPVRLAKAA
jgi:serine/threonine protein kinase